MEQSSETWLVFNLLPPPLSRLTRVTLTAADTHYPSTAQSHPLSQKQWMVTRKEHNKSGTRKTGLSPFPHSYSHVAMDASLTL
jgi:hypothetical protein